MPGGIGHNWFEVELTSEHVYVPGEGGVGQDWFTVELTSEHVPTGEIEHVDRYEGEFIALPAPVPPAPAPAPIGPHHPVVFQHEDRYEAEFLAVEHNVDRYVAYFIAIDRSRIPAEFLAAVTVEDRVEGTVELSDLMLTARREDEELMLLF